MGACCTCTAKGRARRDLKKAVLRNDLLGVCWNAQLGGADVVVTEGDVKNRSPLAVAAGTGNLAMVLALMRLQADVRHQDANKQQAIHRAAANGQLTIVRVLLKHGADPYAKDKWGCNASACAREEGYPNVVAFLKQSPDEWQRPHEQMDGRLKVAEREVEAVEAKCRERYEKERPVLRAKVVSPYKTSLNV